MNCTDPEVKQAFDKAGRLYKQARLDWYGFPMDPSYYRKVDMECMEAFKISGPYGIPEVIEMPPVACAFHNLREAETKLQAGGDNMAVLIQKLMRARERVLAQVHRCMAGGWRPNKRSVEGEADGAGACKAARRV
jgi:hypothetical protein